MVELSLKSNNNIVVIRDIGLNSKMDNLARLKGKIINQIGYLEYNSVWHNLAE